MSHFIVRHCDRLSGSIAVQGAKNSVLPLLAATLLTSESCVIHNCPGISDVDITLDILSHLGCKVERKDHTVTVDASSVGKSDVPEELMRRMRSSIVFLGAILSRTGSAHMSAPGGDDLGSRPIDLHLSALRKLGVTVNENGGCIDCGCVGIIGNGVTLGFPSVGATENIILAAATAKGVTVIHNAAREPEICDLAAFINKMGGKISGAGEGTVVIEGVKKLHGCEYKVMPDRIVSSTLLCAAAVTGGDVELQDVICAHFMPAIACLEEMGCDITRTDNTCRIKAPQTLKAPQTVRTMPYPGFPTDAQAVFMAAVCTASGTGVFIESIFDSRYKHAFELMRLGAKITVSGRTAVVTGVDMLTGAAADSTDLRGGAALVIAGLKAQGETKVNGIYHIDRGYEALETQLNSLGADIKRM